MMEVDTEGSVGAARLALLLAGCRLPRDRPFGTTAPPIPRRINNKVSRY